MSTTIALYGGGFKPPQKGHLKVAQESLKQLPDIDELIIYVGGKSREGITQDDSIRIWNIYSKLLKGNVTIKPSKTPVGDIVRFIRDNPEIQIYWILGARSGNPEDQKDIESRTKRVKEKYPHLTIKVITTSDSNISGTNARKALKKSQEEFNKYLPDNLDSSDKNEIYSLLKSNTKTVNERIYSKENVDFKSWENKLKELDPFGLNEFKTKLSEELKKKDKVMNYKIYSDMDGVIADFDKQFMKYSRGVTPEEYINKYDINKFWTFIYFRGENFWSEIPWTEDGKEYWNYIKKYNPTLLSSPSRAQESRTGKQKWVNKHLPNTPLELEYSYNKKKFASPNSILIDDRKSNIEDWENSGGVGILHTSASNTIKQLKKLGL